MAHENSRRQASEWVDWAGCTKVEKDNLMMMSATAGQDKDVGCSSGGRSGLLRVKVPSPLFSLAHYS